MADTDENKEGAELEENKQAAPAKKAAKKKAAKKKVAKKKVAKKKAAKKKVAAKTAAAEKAPEKAEATVEAVAVAEKPAVQPAPQVPQAPIHGGADEAEQEKNQLIGLWITIAVVAVLLIAALSPSGEKPAKAHKPAATHEPAKAEVTHEPAKQAVKEAPLPAHQPSAAGGEGSKLFQSMVPEKYIFGKKDAETSAEGNRPPKRPEGSPPGYWQYEGGAWHYVPYAQEQAQTQAPAPVQEAPEPEPQPEPQAEKKEGSKLFQQMIPEKFIFGEKGAANAPAPQQGKRPPETPADAPPGYWKYESGQWNYVPYQQGQEESAPAGEKLTSR